MVTPTFMYCDAPSAVASIRVPADATHAGAGAVTLASGASIEIVKADAGRAPSDGERFIATLRNGDRVTICYAPPQRFADAGPTARMAIAGAERTGAYVYALAYPGHARARAVPTALRNVAKRLASVPFAVIAPTTFDDAEVDKNFVLVATPGRDRYRVAYDLAPDCNGANVCSAGSFSGFGPTAIANGVARGTADGDISASASAQSGEYAVTLSDGSVAFYADHPSGASDGGNSTLRWVRHGVLYAIATRISTQAHLIATAESAIRNGSLNGK